MTVAILLLWNKLMKIHRSSDRENAVVITKSGAFLYQTLCNLEDDIKFFRMINYNIHYKEYKHGQSFYSYEIRENSIYIDDTARVYVFE